MSNSIEALEAALESLVEKNKNLESALEVFRSDCEAWAKQSKQKEIRAGKVEHALLTILTEVRSVEATALACQTLENKYPRGITGFVNDCERCEEDVRMCDKCGVEWFGSHRECNGQEAFVISLVKCFHKKPNLIKFVVQEQEAEQVL